MRSRPDKTSEIYNALRGPSVSKASVKITQDHRGEKSKQSDYEWFDDEPLFLYAGRRRCVEQESTTSCLASSSLFRNENSQRSRLFVEKDDFRHPELVDVNKGLKETLERVCETTDKNIRIRKLENKNGPSHYLTKF